MKKLWKMICGWVSRDIFLSRLASGELTFRLGPVRANLSQAKRIEQLIDKELRRLGWPTRRVKVRVFDTLIKGEKAPRWERQFFVNLGSYHGLEPNELYRVLQNLDSKCGYKEILRCVSLMEERVEPCEA